MLTFGLNVAALLALVVGVPGFLFLAGVRFLKRAESPVGKVLSVLLASAGAAGLALVGSFLYRAAPGHSGVLATGESPGGHEYCLVQSHNGLPDGLGEPYTVSLYVRDGERRWRWHYVDHQSLRWAEGRVEFEGGVAGVFEGDAHYRSVDLALQPPGEKESWTLANDLPGELTAEQVAAHHREMNGRSG